MNKHGRDRGAWLRLLDAALDQPQPSRALRDAIAALTKTASVAHITPKLARVLDVVTAPPRRGGKTGAPR